MPPHYESATPAKLVRSTSVGVGSGWAMLAIATPAAWWVLVPMMTAIMAVQTWVSRTPLRRLERWDRQRHGHHASKRASTIAAIIQAVSALMSGFATIYWLVSQIDANAFSGELSKVGAAYFSVATFTTTGFGDIHAASDGARAIVTLQMLLAVGTATVVLGAAVARTTGSDRQ